MAMENIMSREEQFQERMIADTDLMLILTGGVYTVGELGRDGISRDTAPDAFGEDGYLLPCAIVKQRDMVTDEQVIALTAKSGQQVVEIYIYEDHAFVNIDAALSRLFVLFNQHILENAFPAEWVNTIDRERDEGALKGASLARQDWLIPSVKGAI